MIGEESIGGSGWGPATFRRSGNDVPTGTLPGHLPVRIFPPQGDRVLPLSRAGQRVTVRAFSSAFTELARVEQAAHYPWPR